MQGEKGRERERKWKSKDKSGEGVEGGIWPTQIFWRGVPMGSKIVVVVEA